MISRNQLEYCVKQATMGGKFSQEYFIDRVLELVTVPSDHQLTPEEIVINEKQASQEGYIHRVLVAFDIFCNVTFWFGLEDETISSHTRRINDDPSKHSPLSGLIAKFLNLFLDNIQSNHGARAEAGDLERAITIVATERQALGLPPINLLK